MTHFIAGKWIEGIGSEFTSVNPASNELLWRGKSAIKTEVDSAVSAAKASFESWSCLSLEDRIGILKNFQKVIKNRTGILIETISKEVGKPLWESKAELEAMVNKIDISIEAQRVRCSDILAQTSSGLAVSRHRPFGVVAILGPFNFPGHLPGGHIIPALIAGNAVIFKPSEFTPLTAQELAICWEEAGVPEGLFNMVQGGRETGAFLIEHPGIHGIFFTGNAATGQIITEKLVKHPEKILALEMGGNNPLVIGKIQNKEAAAELTIQSAYLTSGQRCTCARRLIVQEGKEGDAFLEILIEKIKKIEVGPYTQVPEPFMGPVISSAMASRLLAAQEELIRNGGLALVEMKLLIAGTGLITPGLIDVTLVKEKLDEEIFGPFLQLTRVPNFHLAIEEANRTSFGLSAGCFSDSKEEYDQFYRKIRAGIVNWNSPLTGASSALPFGGIGRSGNHRPSAFYAADYCSYPVSSIERESI
jgi:succinylglutamic semialdehyde dehydrogenase